MLLSLVMSISAVCCYPPLRQKKKHKKGKKKHADVTVMDLTITYSCWEFISSVISFISITFVRRTVTFPLTALCCYGYIAISHSFYTIPH